MQEYSIIPVTLKKGKDGKVEKKPNFKLLKKATGDIYWEPFTQRMPTQRERQIFMKSDHIAIVTGKISGVTVIDLDGTAEQWLKDQGFELPITPTVRTQSGGLHLYFKYDERLHTAKDINKQKENDRAIDVRNDGGYAVAFGEGYEWIHHIHTTPLQEVPEIFINMANTNTQKQSVSSAPKRKISESISDAYSKARNVNMVAFLRQHGYDVQFRHGFSCIFPDHEDVHPSAEIVTNSKGEYRYICATHDGGRLNLSLIDLWAELQQIDIQQAIEEVLAFNGIEYKESQFVKSQQKKYQFNTIRVGDMSYIKENFKYVYKYLNRYELELRALMDYAESNLYGTEYSYDGQAVFYISARYAGNLIAKYKNTATVNTKRAHTLLNILCTLGIMERVPTDKLTEYAKNSTAKLTKEGREINFYMFHQLTDRVLSVADQRARIMQEKKFKVSAMSKDIIISLFGQDLADKVFPDKRKVSLTYKRYLKTYSKIILQEIQNKGYTTKQETISKLNEPITQRKKEYHFDKVINEICSMYGLECNFANKEIKKRFGIKGRGRKRLIYKA